MNLLLDRCVRRASLVEDLLEGWQDKESTAEPDVDEICQECIEMCALCVRMWDHVLDRLMDAKLKGTDKVGRLVLEALNKALAASGKVVDRVAEARDKEVAIHGAAELDQAIKKLRETTDKAKKTWPFIDYEAVDRAREEYTRGRFRSIEDLLNETQAKSA